MSVFVQLVPDGAESNVINADQALKRLSEGNGRYVAASMTYPNQTARRRKEVAKGQEPFAIIFGCVDSRVTPELVFDRGLGDLFVIRTAGHAVDSATLGSVEFGVEELEIPLVMVLGHERCGAVAATIEAVEKGAKRHGQIGVLVEAIKPAVERMRGQPGDLLDNAVRASVELMVRRLRTSKILAEFLEKERSRLLVHVTLWGPGWWIFLLREPNSFRRLEVRHPVVLPTN